MTLTINRQGKIPVFLQISEQLSDAIAAGEYPPGTLLPSEAAIMAQTGVTNRTARKAVRVLVAAGLAEVIRGKGAFVTEGSDD